jgi:hypothetical protein
VAVYPLANLFMGPFVIGSGTETACAKSLLIGLAVGNVQTYSNPYPVCNCRAEMKPGNQVDRPLFGAFKTGCPL